MIKTTSLITAILGLFFIASSVSAATTNWDNSSADGPTGAVTIAVDNTTIPGAEPVVFEPSTQVNISGGSETTSFSAMAGHEAVKGKDAGQNYGMAADSSAVFWIKSPAAYSAVTGTNSTALAGYHKS